jgi:predicted phage terminase large subunit-like protein
MPPPTILPQQSALREFTGLLSDPEIRRQLRKTLKGFALLYFSHHLYLPPGDYHDKMIEAMDDASIEFLEVVGFRGCSKTTFGSLIVPVYFALERPDEYPFIIPISDTSLQTGINIANIKYELETNDLLKQDYGTFSFQDVEDPVPDPTFESEEEWQAKNLLLSNDVRILARSRGQKIRGLKHRQFRPRAVIIDDPEDSKWVKAKENRDSTEKWLNSEVIPGLDKQKRKLIILINNLHMDALAARVKAKGTFKVLEFPLVNDADEWESCIWKAQYPDQAAIDAERKNAGAVAWEREYKLKVVAEEGAVITPDDIHYYDERPKSIPALKGHGNDLAISEKESADYTAIVSGEVFYVEDKMPYPPGDTPKIFIRPNPFNEHVQFHDYMKRVREIPGELGGANIFFVEDVQYQKAAIQEMIRAMLPVVPMVPVADKRSRLQVVAPYIKNGSVLFPRSGCEQLLAQLFGFGVEAHDDLVDALVYLILGLVEQGLELPKIHWIEG